MKRFETNLLALKDILELVDILNHEGVMIYPTETFYGLGGNGLQETVIDRVYRIKQRSYQNPLPLIIKDLDMLYHLAKMIPGPLLKLAAVFWPGPLTILLPANDSVPKRLMAGTGKIAVRISSCPFVQRVIEEIDFPLISTSANLSGTAPCRELKQVPEPVLSAADAIVDGGILRESLASTIVEFMDPHQITIVRPGPITEQEITRVLQE